MMHVGFARVIWAEYIAPILLLDAAMQQRGMDMQGATVGAALRGRPFQEQSNFNEGAATEGRPYSCIIRFEKKLTSTPEQSYGHKSQP